MNHPLQKLHLIVEGDGDADAMPLLVKRILHHHELFHVSLTRPQISGDVNKSRKRFDDYLNYALKNQCPILWILDCDDKQIGCPVKHVAHFQTAMQSMHIQGAQPIEFAFFVQEFESLFLAEEDALRGYYQLPLDLKIDPNTATRRDAKGEIAKLLPKTRGYKETIDQAKIAQRLDLTTCARVSRDYRHFESALLRLCTNP